MNATILLASSKVSEPDLSSGYVIGAILAFLIMGYLIYNLINPEKF